MNIDETELTQRLERIESAILLLVREKTVKDFYSTNEVASMLGKAEYTVREWCRLGRIRATKMAYARGAHPWAIRDKIGP
jgi:hypothetical protein